ncbi:MAG: hypothetical protein AAF985_17765, partial [Bacteroidota bacterium]
MKKILFALLVLVSYNSIAQTPTTVKAKEYHQLVPLSGKKAPIYYDLDKQKATTLQLEGPGELTVYTRTTLKSQKAGKSNYYLKYYLDDQLLQIEQIKGKKATQKYRYTTKRKGAILSKAAKTKISIPPGKHKISFLRHQGKAPVHARFVYQQGTTPNWQALSSSRRLNRVQITHFDIQKTQHYHRITSEKGFVFRPQQDSRLKIYLRADFDDSMLEETTIRMMLKEDGKTIATYRVASTRSSKVENNTDPHLIAGQLEKIYIDFDKIKKGRQYELVVKGHASALLRV